MNYYVYILTNKKNGTLYIGITNDLLRRIYEHKNKLTPGFTHHYSLHKLVYFETFDEVKEAILKEKQMKKWKREWKLNKINEFNPDWNDLYESIIK